MQLKSMFAASAAMVALGTAFQAWGQAAAPVIEEVVVTAERREANAQKTPLAITAISAAQLEQQGVRTATDLTNIVPGVQIGSNGGSIEIAVRGIGSTNNTEVGDPAVAFNVDGVYAARPRSAAGLFFDLDRTEVLRGPQGTLYGRNATAGSINVITRKPTQTFESQGQLETGDFGLVRGSGAVNLPLADWASVRAAFQVERHDGYTSNGPANDYNDEDAVAGRIHLRMTPREDLVLLVSADYFQNRSAGSASGPLGQYAAPGDPFAFPVSSHGSTSQRNYGFTAQADWTLPFATLTWIGSARRDIVHTLAGSVRDYPQATPQLPGRCEPTTGVGCVTIYFDSDERQDSQEVRLGHAEGPLKWVAGLYYFSETNNVYANIFPAVAFIQPDTFADSEAVFAQGTYSVADRVRVTAGLRYTRDHKGRVGGTYVGVAPAGACSLPGGLSGSLFAAPPGCLLYGNVADFTWESVDYKLGVEYDLTATSLVFASTSTGYKAGGYGDGLPPANNKYNPERLKAFEAGLKNRFLDNRLEANLSTFYYDYQDFQVTALGIVAGQVSAVTVNAAKATLYGGEFEGTYLLGANDRIDGSVAYLHARYDDFTLPTGDAFHPGFASYSGLTLAKSPEWTLNLGYQHSWSLANGGDLSARVQTHFESGKNLDYHNFAVTRQDAYAKTDIMVTYDAPGRAWSVMAYGRNLEDRAVLVAASPDAQHANPLGGSGAYAPPRLYGVQLSARF